MPNPRPSINKPQNDAEYVDQARRLAEFFPALTKYKRRKRLNRSEKGLISKAMREFSEAQATHGRFKALKPSQARHLSRQQRRDMLIGSNVRGAPTMQAVFVPPGTDKIHVRNGRVRFQRGEMEWEYRPVNFAQDFPSIKAELFRAQREIRRNLGSRRSLVEWQLAQTHGFMGGTGGVFDSDEDGEFHQLVFRLLNMYRNADGFVFAIAGREVKTNA